MRPTCEECGYEYSAMMGDNEVPDYCECGGKVSLDVEPDKEKGEYLYHC